MSSQATVTAAIDFYDVSQFNYVDHEEVFANYDVAGYLTATEPEQILMVNYLNAAPKEIRWVHFEAFRTIECKEQKLLDNYVGEGTWAPVAPVEQDVWVNPNTLAEFKYLTVELEDVVMQEVTEQQVGFNGFCNWLTAVKVEQQADLTNFYSWLTQ